MKEQVIDHTSANISFILVFYLAGALQNGIEIKKIFVFGQRFYVLISDVNKFLIVFLNKNMVINKICNIFLHFNVSLQM